MDIQLKDEWLTTVEAAEYLKMKPVFLSQDRHMKRYGIPYYKIGRRVRYKKSDLDKYVVRVEQ